MSPQKHCLASFSPHSCYEKRLPWLLPQPHQEHFSASLLAPQESSFDLSAPAKSPAIISNVKDWLEFLIWALICPKRVLVDICLKKIWKSTCLHPLKVFGWETSHDFCLNSFLCAFYTFDFFVWVTLVINQGSGGLRGWVSSDIPGWVEASSVL